MYKNGQGGSLGTAVFSGPPSQGQQRTTEPSGCPFREARGLRGLRATSQEAATLLAATVQRPRPAPAGICKCLRWDPKIVPAQESSELPAGQVQEQKLLNVEDISVTGCHPQPATKSVLIPKGLGVRPPARQRVGSGCLLAQGPFGL